MQGIPDTGPGLSGFLAHYLWRLYVYFPSTGEWDWAFLLLGLAVSVQVLVLPRLWRGVQKDMEYLQKTRVGEDTGADRGMAATLLGLACLFFSLWFFRTPAGRTFLHQRYLHLPGSSGTVAVTDVSRLLFWVSLVGSLVMAVLQSSIDEVHLKQSGGLLETRPYQRRDLLSLYFGGGVFVYRRNGKMQIDKVVSPLAIYLVTNFFAHVVYWYWSIASEFLFASFVLTALLIECCRVLFVFILHKRTFG